MAPPTTLPDGTPAAASPDAGPREVARAPSLGGPPAESVAEILRFDINPQWVLDRWPRVSTQLALTNLQGLRVPWVSGTRVEDLTGSLTYYFDEQQQVQRLGFQGHTGDPATLITTMTQHFGLQAEPASGGGMYLARSDGQPTSVLRIRYAPVIRSSDLRGSYEIRFELNRPDSGLSREMQALLKADQKVRQWLPVEPKLPEDGPDGKPRPTNNASVENGPPDKTDPTNQPPAPPPALASPATPLPPAETSSPPAQTGGSGPRWPYPGARHDRGF